MIMAYLNRVFTIELTVKLGSSAGKSMPKL